MTARVAAGSRAEVRRVAESGSTRHRVAAALVTLALGVTIAAAGWGLLSALAPHETAADPQVLTLAGGEIHVGAERADVMAHTTMPGMAVPDPLPEGQRRFRVALTLVGLRGEGIVYSPEMFAVSGRGLAPTPPKPPAQSGVVPPGMSASIVLLFQVPEDATDLSLSVDGSSQSVALGATVLDVVADDHGEAAPGGPEHADADEH